MTTGKQSEIHAQAQVLDAAEKGGKQAVEELIERLTYAEIERLESLLRPPDPSGISRKNVALAPPVARFQKYRERNFLCF